MAAELTTVSENTAVVFDDATVRRYDDLAPDTDFELDGVVGRTLPRPDGEFLAKIATVNDVHFGETECGVIEGMDVGPILAAEEGEPPYPETMNRAAAAEIKAAGVDAVVAKGDLTTRGIREEYEQFLACYGETFGNKLHHIRGNHDAYHGETFADDGPIEVDLPGVTLAIIDTTIPLETPGQVTDATAEWLDELAARSTQPVLVFGHHHVWSPTSNQRPEKYFGINPDDSEKLIGVFTRQANLAGYFAGHTHRNRVRLIPATGDVPWVEVGATKDFPGAWAEYRVFEGGILQVMHRIASPEALNWTNRTREMFGGMYPDYSFGQMKDRCFVVC